MSAKPDFVVNTLTRPSAGAATGGFVINLTSSTTPMALSQPKDPTLAQYTFFVSRRREDGRERFRLHMGYFETLQAAEEMLAIVREVYPQAWAGEAPGKKLRANDAAKAATAPAPATPAAPRASEPAIPAKPVAVAAPVRATPPVAAQPLPVVAQLPAPAASAPVKAPAPVSSAPHPFASTPPPAPKPTFEEPFTLSDSEPDFRTPDVPVVHPPAEPEAKAPPRAAPVVSQPPQPVAAKPAPAKAVVPPKPAAAKPAPKPAAKPAAARPAAAKPTVKATPATPPAVAPKIAAKVSAPALQAATPAPAPKVPAPEPTVQMPALPLSAIAAVTNVRQVIDELDDLSDTQTIRLLERHSPYREGSREADVDEAIRVVKPEDAQAMQAIKSDVKRNAPVLFAVQLDWSVTPFDMSKVAPLAIFNAYTLYTTEANREGRTWYGLRLGFFSDAVSAKQVAYYVRSDFKTVSVVPVTTIEKERATDLNAERSGIHRAANVKDGPAPTPQSISASTSGVFKLLEDDTPERILQDVDGESSPRFFKPEAERPATPAAKAAAPDPKKAAATKSRKPGPRGAPKRDAHAQVDEETLDQTLEILGASTLEIEGNQDSGVRHLRVKVDKKGSKFASLIERLSGRK